MISMKKKPIDFGLSIASALLLQNRRISINEIEAIPFVNKREVPLIVSELKKKYNARVETQKVAEQPYLEWKQIVTIS